MDQKSIDLHVHSTESDGTFTPEELITEAVNTGLSAIALTDHDTVSGVEKAQKAAIGQPIELVPGIELSTNYNGKEIHIVGLYIDIYNERLLKETAAYRACRDGRNEKMVEALQKEGFAITMKELVAENPDCVITRGNIARFLYGHGMISSTQEAFEKYIGDGCKCYVGRFKVSAQEAVSLIKEAGGIAILAHPLLYHLSHAKLMELVTELKAAGLDGIEAIYSTYTAGEEAHLKQFAEENGLLVSGGSDFHGTTKPSIRLGTGRGHLFVPYSVLEKIKAAR